MWFSNSYSSLVFSLAIHHTSFREFFLAEKEKHVGFWGSSLKKFGAPTNFWLAFNGFPDTSFSANLKLPLSDYTYWLSNDNTSWKIFSKNRLVITKKPASSIQVGIIVEKKSEFLNLKVCIGLESIRIKENYIFLSFFFQPKTSTNPAHTTNSAQNKTKIHFVKKKNNNQLVVVAEKDIARKEPMIYQFVMSVL